MKIVNHSFGLDKILLEKLSEAAYEILRDSMHEMDEVKKSGQYIDHGRNQHGSFKSYNDLPEAEKENNRNVVRDIPNKLASVGYGMIPAWKDGISSEFRNGEIEKLSELEHERWVKEKLETGWQYAKVTDKANKLHQCIVPWSELPEEEKEKDRILVKGISKIISKAGYKMIRL